MTIEQAMLSLGTALDEEATANEEYAVLKASFDKNLARRNAAENAVSQAHTALEELARQA